MCETGQRESGYMEFVNKLSGIAQICECRSSSRNRFGATTNAIMRLTVGKNRKPFWKTGI